MESGQIFFLASLSTHCYQLLLKIFSGFENCNIKGQKVPRSKKGAEATQKLDCRGTLFKCLRNLDEAIRQDLMQNVVEKKFSFQELSSTASRVKQLKEVQCSFMRSVGVTDWAQACSRYPRHTTTERLETLIGLKPSSSTFTQYVQGAKLSETEMQCETNQFDHNLLKVSCDDSFAIVAFIPRDPQEVGAALIRNTLSEAASVAGFKMCITDVTELQEVGVIQKRM